MSSSKGKGTASSKKGPTGAGKKGAVASQKGGGRARKTPATAPGDVTHSPIIITDGSASVEFDEEHYPLIGGVHQSGGLHLENVEARQPVPQSGTNPQPTHICHTFMGNALHKIVVLCRVGGNTETITIVGAKAGASRSPKIDFNHQEFMKDHAHFPPKNTSSGRFVNANRRIISFRIIRVSTNTEVHNCPLVAAGNVEFTINDLHG